VGSIALLLLLQLLPFLIALSYCVGGVWPAGGDDWQQVSWHFQHAASTAYAGLFPGKTASSAARCHNHFHFVKSHPKVIFTALSPEVLRSLARYGVRDDRITLRIAASIDAALET